MGRRLGLVAAAVLVLVAGCGDENGRGDDNGRGAQVTDASGTVELEVTAGVVDDPAARGSARLTCGPDGATGTGWLDGEAAAEACRRLADPAVRAHLAPPPAGQVCAEVYGGPDVATVVGSVDGEPVDAAFDRHDACATTRWDALAPLLPEPVAG